MGPVGMLLLMCWQSIFIQYAHGVYVCVALVIVRNIRLSLY